MQFALTTADDTQRLTKIDLGMTRRVGQRNEYLLRLTSLLADIICDDGELPGEPVLVTQSLKYALRRMPLLLDHPFIVFKDLIDNRGKTIQLRTYRSSCSLISQRY